MKANCGPPNFLGLTIDQHLTWNEHLQKNIKQDIKIMQDYVQIKTFFFTPTGIENPI